MRNLLLIFGDQLNHDSAVFQDFDRDQDRVWMAEVHEEATHVWCHKSRLVAFFSAMRHFRDELTEKGLSVTYHEFTPNPENDQGRTFSALLKSSLERKRPQKIIAVEPGDHRVQLIIEEFAKSEEIKLEWRSDNHFYSSLEDFRDWASGRKSLVLEDFYRRLRKRHNILMDGQEPAGGEWNYDQENRDKFPKSGPPDIKSPRSFRIDETTQAVIDLVEERFSDHPGELAEFDLPVTHKQARASLQDFIEHRLPTFGQYQDAMWTDHAFHSHSRLSFALNVHLLNPRHCVQAAIDAYVKGDAPLNSVEGFVRQVLGWREYVRGIYWLYMPDYIEKNALECDELDVPDFYWNGQTEMNCLKHSLASVVKYGYAHHIQRLMVLGLFAQLLGVHPRKFHDWHMAMYPDAIDWVSLPNTLGMSQYGDGGIVGTKPYCASGNYINKMSNYCQSCQFNYKQATGEEACPFTTLYYDFLDRHRERFASNRRMTFQLKNLNRKDEQELTEIREQAAELKEKFRPDSATNLS